MSPLLRINSLRATVFVKIPPPFLLMILNHLFVLYHFIDFKSTIFFDLFKNN
nr:MAG TPA: hypothetical protein [Caudoviricetes sp.]